MALMVSVSGIRGIFGEDLNPQNIANYASAFGTWAGPGKIVVGRDTRVTGELCEKIVTAALQAVGCDVVSLGIAPTPTVAMGVLRHKAKGGIIISASHNPAEWNALKMLNGKSEFVDEKEGEAILEIAQNNRIAYKGFDAIGGFSTDGEALAHHVDKILELPYIDAGKIRERKWSVVVDAVNGAGSEAVPYLLDRLGAKHVKKLHCTPNGIFPHNPEPLPEHLGEITDLMKSGKYDIGFVTDPDADRLAIVDNNGRLFGEEYTQAAAFDFYLGKNRGDICTNLSSSMICDHIAEKQGVKCHRSAVGEINVVKKMIATGSVISGEGNGGVINPDLHNGRDALVGIAMVLQMLTERGISASEYRSGLPDYAIHKSKIPLKNLNADNVLNRVTHKFARYNPDVTDGVKVVFEEGWAHLRKSNTEPIIRLYTEAATKEQAKELAERIMKAV